MDIFRFVRAGWRNALGIVFGILCVMLALMLGRLLNFGGLLPLFLTSLALFGVATYLWGGNGWFTGARLVSACATIVGVFLGLALVRTAWGLLPAESTATAEAVWEAMLPLLIPFLLALVVFGAAWYWKQYKIMRIAGAILLVVVAIGVLRAYGKTWIANLPSIPSVHAEGWGRPVVPPSEKTLIARIQLYGFDKPSRDVGVGFSGSELPPNAFICFAAPDGTKMQRNDLPLVLVAEHAGKPGYDRLIGSIRFFGPAGEFVEIYEIKTN